MIFYKNQKDSPVGQKQWEPLPQFKHLYQPIEIGNKIFWYKKDNPKKILEVTTKVNQYKKLMSKSASFKGGGKHNYTGGKTYYV